MTQIDLDEVAKSVADLADNMDSNLASVATRLIEEVEALAQVIEATRSEIAALNPSEMRKRRFATANDELDAVVGATEAATNAILEAAEHIEGVADEVGEDPALRLTDAVTAIYEACSFQDVTGQRISKVVGALHQIEINVEGLLATFGDETARARRDKLESGLDRRLVKAAGWLDGPQSRAEAQDQDDIDAFFENLD